MSTNMNPVTGIRYGIIAANSLDPEIIDKIQRTGVDRYHEACIEELRDAVRHACKDYVRSSEIEEVADLAVENMDDFMDEEPTHSFEIECPGYGSVRGQTTWLGGALMVWIFKSPFQEACDLCSPCVPGCGNLDSRNPDGYQCYDVPNDWRN